MTRIIPCCIANANGAHCNCHIPDASVLYDENKRLRADLAEAVKLLHKLKDDDERYGDGPTVLDHGAIDAFLARVGGGEP